MYKAVIPYCVVFSGKTKIVVDKIYLFNFNITI